QPSRGGARRPAAQLPPAGPRPAHGPGGPAMSGLRRLPFRHQLMLVTILASTTALVLASAGLLYYEAARSRREEERDLQSLARVVATNSTAVLAFADERGATENLASLSRKHQVELAVLYGATGQSLAVYRREGAEPVP